MTDNEVMTLKKALFILRHGSAEGEHKYFEAIEIIENEITHQKAEIERYEKSFAEVLKSIKEVQILVVKDIAKAKADAVKEFAERVYTEIKDAMESNYKAKEERVAKCKKYGIPICPEDGFLMYCDGKNHALSGIDYFIDNLVKEMVGDA